jgi:hypothetical protein
VADATTRDFISFLPDTIWYLTSDGQDMYCRRPYGFLFSTREAAQAFAVEMSTSLELTAIGIATKEVLAEDGLAGLRRLQVTRLFVDPKVDPTSGDVLGTILRLEEIH